MTTEKRILVLGGDSRQIYMSQYLRKNGARAVLFGFDNIKQEKPELEFDDLEFASGSLKDEISKSDIIILFCPLPEIILISTGLFQRRMLNSES